MGSWRGVCGEVGLWGLTLVVTNGKPRDDRYTMTGMSKTKTTIEQNLPLMPSHSNHCIWVAFTERYIGKKHVDANR